MSQTLWLTSEFVVVECYKCGIAFGIPEDWDRTLRKNHKTFYCPKGHGQVYVGKSDEQKLKERLRVVQDDRDRCITNMETKVSGLKAEVKSEKGRSSYYKGKRQKEINEQNES